MKKLNLQEKNAAINVEKPLTKGKRDQLWEDFWAQIPASTPTKDSDAWDQAVETSEKQDPKEMLDGQRFQGQGQ